MSIIMSRAKVKASEKVVQPRPFIMFSQIPIINGNGHALESGLADGSLLRDGRIAVVGHGGAVLTSDDQGRSFKLVNRPDRRSLSGVTSDSQGNLILVGQGGVRIASPSGADLAPKQ